LLQTVKIVILGNTNRAFRFKACHSCWAWEHAQS